MPDLQYHEHHIHYERYGHGERLLIALHGIGGNGRLFKAVTEVLWEDYTVLALDLPYHGDTEWKALEYTPNELSEVLMLLLDRYGYQRFSVLVHSMGGRLLVGLTPRMAHLWDALYLFAPGGFQYVFTESRWLFGHGMRERMRRYFESNEGFLRILEGAKRLKLLSRQMYWLLTRQIDTPERRARLFRSWVSLSHVPMRMGIRERQCWKQHQIPCYFFGGKADHITPIRHFKHFIRHYPYATLTVVEGNHFFVKDDLIQPFSDWYQVHRSQ